MMEFFECRFECSSLSPYAKILVSSLAFLTPSPPQQAHQDSYVYLFIQTPFFVFSCAKNLSQLWFSPPLVNSLLLVVSPGRVGAPPPCLGENSSLFRLGLIGSQVWSCTLLESTPPSFPGVFFERTLFVSPPELFFYRFLRISFSFYPRETL